MSDSRVLDVLNQSIARELQVIVQYMWQHVMAIGLDSAAIAGKFRGLAMEEMKHAEQFAERLNYLNGVPTTKPTPVRVGGTIEEMLQDDVVAEEEAIALYKGAIELCFEVKDHTTRTLFEKVLADEEEHHDLLTTLLEKTAPAHKTAQQDVKH